MRLPLIGALSRAQIAGAMFVVIAGKWLAARTGKAQR